MSSACPCGTGRDYDDCCGPLHTGRAQAPTAEALMRSRYSAYARGEIDYIIATHDVSTEAIDREATEEWSKKAEWKGLEIRATDKGTASDYEGMVEFVAKYRQDGHDLTHHERSRFKKKDGRWLYVDGTPVKPAPVKAAPKTGRNEPCPCGSGKKYKKCHGAEA